MAEAILTKQNGVVTMDKSFDYLCSTLKNGTYTVSIKRKVEPRTLSQNALMWLWFAWRLSKDWDNRHYPKS